MNRLLLFAKRPRLGKVKTRLCPPLSPAQALALYRAFLDDQVEFVRGLCPEGGAEVWLDGPWTAACGAGISFDGCGVHLQGPGDLGRRMRRAFEHGGAEARGATVVVGADSPTLPRDLVERAFARLAGGAPAVVAPSVDGGYVLLGLHEPRRELFDGLPWGTPSVLELTRARARDADLALEILPPWYDVDDACGLRMLRRELRDAAARGRAPATARLLAGELAATGREEPWNLR